MSKYTTMFRWPIEQQLELLDLDRVESSWPETYEFAGLADYPIFDEVYRSTLNDKIYRHFWYREIGFETWGQFRWHLRTKMHELMPYYNQLYESELLEIENPLYSKDMRYEEEWTRDETINVSESGTLDRTAESESSSHDRNVYQDTPMNALDTGAVESLDYATSITYDDSTAESKSTVDQGTTDKRDELGDYDGTKQNREYGYDVPQAEILLKYRETFLNIDMMILRDLEILFMGLW